MNQEANNQESAAKEANTQPAATSRKSQAQLLATVRKAQLRSDLPNFEAGDTVKVHGRIVEGNKERVQVFEGVVISRRKTNSPQATFTVRKISYNVGVERTFLLHSPRIEKIEIVTRGAVRRAKLFYLRGMKGKAGKVRSRYVSGEEAAGDTGSSTEAAASNSAA